MERPARPVVELASLRRRLASALYESLLLVGVLFGYMPAKRASRLDPVAAIRANG